MVRQLLYVTFMVRLFKKIVKPCLKASFLSIMPALNLDLKIKTNHLINTPSAL